PILPILPSQGVKEAIWGKIFRDFLLEHGINKNDIFVTGSPRHDIFFKKRSNKNNKNTILIAGNGFFDTNFNGRDTRAYDYLDDCIIKILETLKKIPNRKPLVKLHPGRVYYDIKPLIQKIDPTIPIYQNQNIVDLLESCDVMISLNFSTVILDAMILSKPVLLILPEKQGFEEELLVKRGTVLYVKDINKIESAIHDILFNQKIRERLIQNGKEFVDDYFENQGNASNSLSKILQSL
ncbi:MAG TPA: CDP-glycerol glycerophosphotransferase family protein, partial [Candidatus Nitrosotalea sp.]|nr:CDP-glycerol glycerophosphotransferase family protein [Candidatus Nitrosotalea sp.]